MAFSQNRTNLMDCREVFRDHAIELHESSNDESHDSSNDESHDSSNDESHDSSNDESRDSSKNKSHYSSNDKSHATSNEASQDPSNDESHDSSNNKSYDGDYSPRIQSPEESLPDLIEYKEVYRDHAIELQDSSNDESRDSSNDASRDPSNDPSNGDYSPRIQSPENSLPDLKEYRKVYRDHAIELHDSSNDDTLPDLYSNCELENALLCLVDDDKDEKWYRLKYKLGLSRDNKEAESIRRKMRNCMFDVHSSEWCQVPLIGNTPSVSIQMDSEDSTSSANYKPVDEGSESSPVISDEKTSSDAAISESDGALKESDDCTPKTSIVPKAHQKGYEETEIDFISEPEYPSLASLYLI